MLIRVERKPLDTILPTTNGERLGENGKIQGAAFTYLLDIETWQ